MECTPPLSELINYLVRLEPVIAELLWAKTIRALDRTVTVNGCSIIKLRKVINKCSAAVGVSLSKHKLKISIKICGI